MCGWGASTRCAVARGSDRGAVFLPCPHGPGPRARVWWPGLGPGWRPTPAPPGSAPGLLLCPQGSQCPLRGQVWRSAGTWDVTTLAGRPWERELERRGGPRGAGNGAQHVLVSQSSHVPTGQPRTRLGDELRGSPGFWGSQFKPMSDSRARPSAASQSRIWGQRVAGLAAASDFLAGGSRLTWLRRPGTVGFRLG